MFPEKAKKQQEIEKELLLQAMKLEDQEHRFGIFKRTAKEWVTTGTNLRNEAEAAAKHVLQATSSNNICESAKLMGAELTHATKVNELNAKLMDATKRLLD